MKKVTNFTNISSTPEALGEFLQGLQILDGPWDKSFQFLFCTKCKKENCVNCPHEEKRNNPSWWLKLGTEVIKNET